MQGGFHGSSHYFFMKKFMEVNPLPSLIAAFKMRVYTRRGTMLYNIEYRLIKILQEVLNTSSKTRDQST